MQIFIEVKFGKKKIEKKNDRYIIYIKDFSKSGEGNKRIIKEMGSYLKVNENKIKIIKGLRSRKKLLLIEEEF
jgi:uncharacterized protein YggU (UPF0235/DUF167 family)